METIAWETTPSSWAGGTARAHRDHMVPDYHAQRKNWAMFQLISCNALSSMSTSRSVHMFQTDDRCWMDGSWFRHPTNLAASMMDGSGGITRHNLCARSRTSMGMSVYRRHSSLTTLSELLTLYSPRQSESDRFLFFRDDIRHESLSNACPSVDIDVHGLVICKFDMLYHVLFETHHNTDRPSRRVPYRL
jgi:hypothetical protein